MAPALLALLPQLMGMLQKKKEQPAQGPAYNQAPPAPEDQEEHDNRKAVLGKLQMPGESPKLADQDLYDTLDYPG